jgi:hypothetical protein
VALLAGLFTASCTNTAKPAPGTSTAAPFVSGYVRPASGGTLSMRVREPASTGSRPMLRIGSQARQVPVQAGFAQWTMSVTSQQATTWALSRG